MSTLRKVDVNQISSNTDTDAAHSTNSISVATLGTPNSGQSAPDAPKTANEAGSDKQAIPPVKPTYPPPASTPTQVAPLGIRFDFNRGARIVLPARTDDGLWTVRLTDLDTGNILFESKNKGAFVASSKRFYVRFGMEIWDENRMVFEHAFNCRDQEVLIQFPIGTLGDVLAWFPYAARFQKVHSCRLTCAISSLIHPLLQATYPQITFVTHEELVERQLQDTFYATYSLGLFFEDKDNIWQPTDFRMVGLHRTAGYILGVDPAESPCDVVVEDGGRPISEPYVCIAVQSSSGCKMWNNPNGWHEVIVHLKQRGYRVICIDQKPVHGSGLLYTHIPHGAEDETGDRPLTERARWLKHADAFVGLSSGLSWLAYAARVPTVVISGFTHPTNEFTTPYRVINWHTCNSCWNDPNERFQHKDFMWCPRHQNTPRHFECTKLITGAHVNAQIDRALSSKA